MDNHTFVAQWAHGRVLDYGCGAGEIVRAMRSRGLNAWGCDLFYEGGDSRRLITDDVAPYLLPMTDGIPFDQDSFDTVVSNTVLEHVVDLDAVLGEISRVVRPGGMSLHLFPHLECWREGHSEIPLLHRMPRSMRVPYAAALRSLGLGAHHGNKSVMQWSRDFCNWLDQWTHYRPLLEIKKVLARHAKRIEFIEPMWLCARQPAARKLPVSLQRLVARKLGGLAVVLHH